MTTGAGRTRWGHTALAAGAASVATVAMAVALNSGVLAAEFVPGGVPIELTVAQANVEGLGGAADTIALADGTTMPVISLDGEAGTLTDLCAVMPIDPPVGPSFVLIARAPARRADRLAILATSFSGDAHAENIIIGRDASALTRSGLEGPAGGAGLQADRFVLAHADADLIGVKAETFALDGLTVELGPEGSTC